MTRRCYAVLAEVSFSYSPLQGRLVTCYSPVRHCTQDRSPFLVRLACVRHAASVDSEPGSNSRLKPVASSARRRSSESCRNSKPKLRLPYLVRSAEEICLHLTTGTFNMFSKIQKVTALAGLFGSGQAASKSSLGVPELVAFLRVTSVLTWRLPLKRDFLRVSTLGFRVKRLAFFFSGPIEALSSRHCPLRFGKASGATTWSRLTHVALRKNLSKDQGMRTATPEARASFAHPLNCTFEGYLLRCDRCGYTLSITALGNNCQR